MGLTYVTTLFFIMAVVSFGNAEKPSSDPCIIDGALYSSITQDTYIFKDDMYARWSTKYNAMSDYGKIADTFKGVDYPVDAAIETHFAQKRSTLFFKKSTVQVYSYDAGKVTDEMEVDDFATGLPSSIDAAAYINEELYFFKGEKYYVMKGRGNEVSAGMSIAEKFSEVPTPVDGAVYRAMNPGEKISAYFFSGPSTYYIYNPNKKTIARKIRTTMGSETGWPGLIESPLFSKCGCSCDSVTLSNDGWRFEKIQYKHSRGSFTEVGQGQSKEVTTTDTNNLRYIFKYTDSFSFNPDNETTAVKQGSYFIDNTPDFTFMPNSDEIQRKNVGHLYYYFQSGKKVSGDIEFKNSWQCQSPTRKPKTCKAFLKTINIKVPYTMTWINKERGCPCYSSGMTDFTISHHGHIYSDADGDARNEL